MDAQNAYWVGAVRICWSDTIQLSCLDAAGNSASTSALVTVPHDQRKN